MNRNLTCFKLIACAAVLLFSACGKPAVPAETSAPVTETAAESSAAAVTSSAAETAAPATETAAESSTAAGAPSAAEASTAASAEASIAPPVSSGISEKEFEEMVESQYLSDEDFIANVRYGLEQRWSQVAARDGSGLDTKDFRKYASEAVQAELDGIGELLYYSFKDENLPGLASSYYSALKDQLQGIKEAESQEALSQSEVYMRGFCMRTIVLHELKENYGLTVSDPYAANLDQAVSRYEDALQYLGIK